MEPPPAASPVGALSAAAFRLQSLSDEFRRQEAAFLAAQAEEQQRQQAEAAALEKLQKLQLRAQSQQRLQRTPQRSPAGSQKVRASTSRPAGPEQIASDDKTPPSALRRAARRPPLARLAPLRQPRRLDPRGRAPARSLSAATCPCSRT